MHVWKVRGSYLGHTWTSPQYRWRYFLWPRIHLGQCSFTCWHIVSCFTLFFLFLASPFLSFIRHSSAALSWSCKFHRIVGYWMEGRSHKLAHSYLVKNRTIVPCHVIFRPRHLFYFGFEIGLMFVLFFFLLFRLLMMWWLDNMVSNLFAAMVLLFHILFTSFSVSLCCFSAPMWNCHCKFTSPLTLVIFYLWTLCVCIFCGSML